MGSEVRLFGAPAEGVGVGVPRRDVRVTGEEGKRGG